MVTAQSLGQAMIFPTSLKGVVALILEDAKDYGGYSY